MKMNPYPPLEPSSPLHLFCSPKSFKNSLYLVSTFVILLIVTEVVISSQISGVPSDSFLHSSSANAIPRSSLDQLAAARASFDTWLLHLRRVAIRESGTANISTARVGCREYESGAQSCVFEGLICVDTRRNATEPGTESEPVRPPVYIVDDEADAETQLHSDWWCQYRHQAADPRYFGSRHWPILENTVAPQWSCMDAVYKNQSGLLGLLSNGSHSVKWVDTMTLVDLDYKANSHNSTSCPAHCGFLTLLAFTRPAI